MTTPSKEGTMSQSKESVLQVYPRMAVVEVEDDWWVVFDDSAKIAKAVRIGCGMTEDAALDDAASKLPHPEPPLCKCGHERDGEFGHDVEGAGNCGGNNGTCPCTKYEPPSPAGEIASEPEPVPAEGAATESEEEQAITQLIMQRDNAEDALSQAYYLVTGRSPEWSNLFGHDEALGEIEDALTLLRKSLPSAPEAAAGPGTKLTIDDCTSDEILQGEECAAAIDDDELRAVLAQTEAILLHCERRLSAAPIAPAAQEELIEELRDALWEAAQSLRIIADGAGRREFMENMDQVRGYANSRANVAHERAADLHTTENSNAR